MVPRSEVRVRFSVRVRVRVRDHILISRGLAIGCEGRLEEGHERSAAVGGIQAAVQREGAQGLCCRGAFVQGIEDLLEGLSCSHLGVLALGPLAQVGDCLVDAN